MGKIHIELPTTFDGRASVIKGFQLFKLGQYRVGWFKFELYDKTETISAWDLVTRA